MRRSRLSVKPAALLWVGLAALATWGVAALVRAHRAAAGVPLSPLSAGWFVGADYVERRGVGTGGRPDGVMDDVSVYAREGFDPSAIHPEIRRFYERTADYEMRSRVRWHPGFRRGAAAASAVTSRVQQLNLPGPADESWHGLTSRFADLDPEADPRTDARAWIRTDAETGAAVFVAAYATHERDGETFDNVAVPLPGGNLGTVLRMRHLDGDPEGVELTTFAPGDPGLYLRTPVGAFALPMDQRFRVWPGDSPTAPDVAVESALAATHEMWLCGRQFLTVTYGVTRADDSAARSAAGPGQ
ncbi:MAG: hypothetical protein ABEJ22_09465 [Haloferacaceae archaeon]